MQIVINLPHVFKPGSPPGENQGVLRALQTCSEKIESVDTRNNSGSAKGRSGVYYHGANGGTYAATFNIPNTFNIDTPQADNAAVLRALLDCMIDINCLVIEYHPGIPDLYRSGVFYRRTTIWDPIPALYSLGYGDCKSLTAALIAQYRMRGIAANPVFRFAVNSHKIPDFHILVQTADGFEDPSKRLGMGRDELSYFYTQKGY